MEFNLEPIVKESWGEFNGHPVDLYRLKNTQSAFVEIITYGAIVKSINVPDKQGMLENVVAGFDNIEGYLQDTCYIGATIGRFANRIKNGCFKMSKQKFDLDKNDGVNTNHGGFYGFNSKFFDARIEDDKLVLSAKSEAGEGGFPGHVTLIVSYRWTEKNALEILYKAETDGPTPLNITNHSYFNLSGFQKDIQRHSLQIESDQVVEVDENYIPTGKLIPVGNLAFNKDSIFSKMKDNNGINSYYIFKEEINSAKPKCILLDNFSGRTLEVYTSYPGVQVYTGDFLKTKDIGSHHKKYTPFDALCLECHHYPDYVNNTNFPSGLISYDRLYSEVIKYEFGI